MMTARAQLEIIEAAYRLDLPDAEWLQGIAQACLPQLGRGFGLCAFEFRHTPEGRPEIVAGKMLDMPDELAASYPRIFASLNPDIQARPFRQGPCTTGSRMMGGATQLAREEVMLRNSQTFGIRDSVWITAAEPSGWGLGLHAGRSKLVSLSNHEIEQWSRVAAHLGAAVRLRRRLERTATPDVPAVADPEAVFSPEGRVEHAQGEAEEPAALERLRDAIADVERIRRASAGSERSPGLERWQGLVDARWSLLDHFESGGKRYVVARENKPAPPGAHALTLRERQVVAYAALGHDNKVIAYDLGIAHSTVRVLLARASAKFGVSDREHLIAAFERSQRAANSGRLAVPCLASPSQASHDS